MKKMSPGEQLKLLRNGRKKLKGRMAAAQQDAVQQAAQQAAQEQAQKEKVIMTRKGKQLKRTFIITIYER